MLVVITALFLCCLSKSSSLDLFREWKSKFNKTYESPEEEGLRFGHFLASLDRIHKRKATSSQVAQFGLTKFSDLSVEEFRSTILMKNKITPDRSHAGPPQTLAAQAPIPKAFDWRSKSVVTPVKNQGQCGSCWAFSATETLESAWMLKYNYTNTTMKTLGPQQIVDCDWYAFGCGGGQTFSAYHYLMGAGGQETEANYPYKAVDGTCAFQPSNVFAKLTTWNFACYPESEQGLLQSAWSFGPISICVDAANWQDYTSGIMTGWQCAWINQLDHCVQLTGWDFTGSTPYWNVRNSWGADWGETGYIRLQYGQNTCGLTFDATYVTAA